MNNQLTQIAIAILYQGDNLLMQLRDDIPGIAWPGHWGLFGGHIEPGETPEIAVKREVTEEIGYTLPDSFSLFGCYADEKVMRHVFQAPLEVPLNQLVLSEGWDMGFLTLEDVKRGSCYSEKAGGFKPLGPPHQKILLDFYQSRE